MDNTFGLKLKELRLERGLTQQQLSNIVSLDRTSIVKYETAVVGPSKEALKKIAEYFDVSIDYLLGNEKAVLDPGIKILQRAASEKGLDESELLDILSYAKSKYPSRFEGIGE